MLSYQNVSFGYTPEKKILAEFNCTVQTGQFCALLGASGCGKTTVLKLAKALIRPISGRIELAGETIEEHNILQIRRTTGFVQQNTGLFPHMSVYANIALPCTLLGWEEEKTRQQVHQVMQWMELDVAEYAQQLPAYLSGGQQQRVALGRALVAEPKILLLDEPFSALDPLLKSQLHALLVSLHQRLHYTIILVTHDIDEAKELATDIKLMRAGAIEQEGTFEQLSNQPATDYVRDYMRGVSSPAGNSP